MGKYYLFSDFNEEKGFSLIANEFKKDIKDYNEIVFIASCPTIGEITDKYVKKYLEWFDRIGIHFKSKIKSICISAGAFFVPGKLDLIGS